MKKFTRILLVALLVVACLPLAALAADSATITGANVTAVPGATAKVAFTITEATYATYSMSIVYDAEDLNLTDLVAGEATPKGFGFNPDNGRFNCAQDNNETFSGVLVTAVFEVPADAKVGDVYPVTLTVRNVTNQDREQLDIAVVAGSVTVVCAHNDASWTVTKAATCTEDGTKSLICSYCGEVLDTEVIPALGHAWGDWVITAEAECDVDGSKYRVCANCGEKETVVIPQLGHDPADPVREEHKAATYDEDGCYDMVVYCKRCGVELEREHIRIPATGRDPIPDTGDFTVALGMVLIVAMMIPCLLISKFRAVK